MKTTVSYTLTYYSVIETNNSACHGELVPYNNAYEIFTRAVLLKNYFRNLGYPVTYELCRPCKVMPEAMGTCRALDGRYAYVGLKITSVLVRCF